MGFSLRFDGHVPASFVDAVRPPADEVNGRRWEATNGVGEFVIKAQESKIWNCAPRPPEQREPVKFEAGQVVRCALLETRNGDPMLVERVTDVHAFCVDVGIGDRFQMSIVGYVGATRVVSPAPRAGDTWTSGESVAHIECESDEYRINEHLRIVSDGEPFVGDVVAVARKLWEGGYRRADRSLTAQQIENAPRITKAIVNGRTAQVARTLRDGKTAYVTLDDMKECVPASLSAFDGTWPVLTPSADVDGGVHPTRASIDRVFGRLNAAEQKYMEAEQARAEQQRRTAPRDDLPRAGDVYEHTDGTIVEVREGNGRLYTHVLRAAVPCPLLVEAEEPSAFAALLRRHGYKQSLHQSAKDVRGDERIMYAPQTDLTLGGGTRDPSVPVGRLPEGTGSTVDRVRDCIARCAERGDSVGDTARNIPRAIDSMRVDRATGDDLRKLAEAYGVLPELRAGMVVRVNVAQPAWGVVKAVRTRGFTLRWSCGTTVHHDSTTFDARVTSGIWTVVDPDVRPIASLAYAVAAIFALPDRATSRRYVDDALALLRGEPFVDAIRAALVGAAESTNLTPSEIAATIAALRHWEKHRPFDRDLDALQRRTGDVRGSGPWDRLQGEATDVLVRALGYRPVWDYDNLWFLYERARSSRRAPSPVAGRYRSVFSVTSARSSRPL